MYKRQGVYKIPVNAFVNKQTLIKCMLPEKLERIENGAFSNTSLTGTLQLPEGLKSVCGFDRTKITNIIFPSTLEEISSDNSSARGAFEQCSSLMCEISLPQSLKEIGQAAFANSAIKGNLSLPASLKTIGTVSYTHLTLPTNVNV